MFPASSCFFGRAGATLPLGLGVGTPAGGGGAPATAFFLGGPAGGGFFLSIFLQDVFQRKKRAQQFVLRVSLRRQFIGEGSQETSRVLRELSSPPLILTKLMKDVPFGGDEEERGREMQGKVRTNFP